MIEKRDTYLRFQDTIPSGAVANYEGAFAIEYTYNSTAIEGNTHSHMETKLVLEDQLTVGGKRIRELFEIVNHDRAFGYVQQHAAEGNQLNEKITKEIHQILMKDIQRGGVYREVGVRIREAKHTPPPVDEMHEQLAVFYEQLLADTVDDIEKAAWTHAEFVKIHPFTDGNGRLSRLMMNYQLIAGGFLPVSVPFERRFEYYNSLEQYALEGNLSLLVDMIAELESERLELYLKAMEIIRLECQGILPSAECCN